MEDYIPKSEAIASYDRVIGAAFLLFIAFAALTLIAVILYEKRRDRKAKQEIEERVEEAEKRIRSEYEKKRRSTLTFRLWQEEKRKRETAESDLLTVTAERDEAQKKLANLESDAAACPAYGMIGKRGAIA